MDYSEFGIVGIYWLRSLAVLHLCSVAVVEARTTTYFCLVSR